MDYTQDLAITDTRRHLKDDTENIWTNDDIKYFIDEAISIIKQTVPLYFSALHKIAEASVSDITPKVIHIDSEYQMLIPIFSAARCFEQDEQSYRAVQKMNEFESRKEEMTNKILESDAYADILANQEVDAVKDVYFTDTLDEETIIPVGLM